MKNGEPGFVSESGKPANLFHVEFDDDPNHPYGEYLLFWTGMFSLTWQLGNKISF